MATRPAPAKRNQPTPGVRPTPQVRPTPSVKPTTQVKPTPQAKPVGSVSRKTGEPQGQRPPKPKANPGPGRVWKWQNGSWQAVRKTISVGGGGGGGGAASDAGGGADPTVTPDTGTEETYDIPKTEEDIQKEAQTQVGYMDPQYSGQFTRLMSGLGLGYGAQGGTGYSSFEDVFGTPSGTVDPSKFVIRDAMGRPITAENYESILGSDVYSEQGKKNIAGTALGDLIAQARQSGAEAAEARSSSGISSGSGVAAAQAAGRRTAGETGFNALLGKLQEGVTGIQSGRGEAYLNAMREAAEKPGSAVKTTPGTAPEPPAGGAAGPAKKPPTPKKPKKGDKRVSGGWNQVWNGKKWVSTRKVKK